MLEVYAVATDDKEFETELDAALDKVYGAQSVVQQPAQTAVAVAEIPLVTEAQTDIEPLTQPEKESEEVRQYEIQRTDYWEKFYGKSVKTLPAPITPQQQQQFVWSAVEHDVEEFKKGLYQIIGADIKPSSDTVLIFKAEQDADDIRELGFDTVAAVKGSGMVPFQTAVTMLKMKYKRVVLFGNSVAFELIRKAIDPGSIYVDEFVLQDINKELNTDDSEGYDTEKVKQLIQDHIKTDEVQGCSVLRSADAIRDNVFNILSLGIEKIDTVDPRAVIQGIVDGLKRIQFLDARFPAPLTEKSLWGILGDFVELAYPTTVACREMLLYQMLPIIGVLLGDAYYLPFGSDKHFPSVFSLAIGKTSEGKGQAKHHVEDAISLVDSAWFKQNVHSNPASGEGLIRMLAGTNVLHVQVRKSRVAVFNSEMVTTFNAAARRDSTLSGYLRAAYDGDRIENFRSDKRNSFAAEHYLLGFCGTITPQELRDVMPAIDWKNGSANRFLWCIGYRDKNLGRSAVRPNFIEWAKRVQALVELNRNTEATPINYSADGAAAWDDWERSLPEHNDDLLSESQARSKANCARIANLYAQLDERRLAGWQVRLEARHVEAAIEIVNRSRQSVEWYLTQASQVQLDSTATQDDLMVLKKAMAAAGRDGVPELTKNDVCRLFSHKTAEERDELCILAGFSVYSKAASKEGGKPVTVWTWANKQTDQSGPESSTVSA